jgi:hypothetical protein
VKRGGSAIAAGTTVEPPLLEFPVIVEFVMLSVAESCVSAHVWWIVASSQSERYPNAVV